jgi:ketosteroid isomerase-like protein
MHPNAALIERFYKAFQAKDAEAMAACYADDVVFNDPVFHDLRGPLAGDMWRMLCARGKDLTLEFSGVRADDREGAAHWEARYTFSQTGNKVLNIIDARFEFRDGRIVAHTDGFDLYRWMSQALGLKGVLLGWLPPVQAALRKTARKGLDDWRAKAASGVR